MFTSYRRGNSEMNKLQRLLEEDNFKILHNMLSDEYKELVTDFSYDLVPLSENNVFIVLKIELNNQNLFPLIDLEKLLNNEAEWKNILNNTIKNAFLMKNNISYDNPKEHLFAEYYHEDLLNEVDTEIVPMGYFPNEYVCFLMKWYHKDSNGYEASFVVTRDILKSMNLSAEDALSYALDLGDGVVPQRIL
jgi:hypothetical protein